MIILELLWAIIMAVVNIALLALGVYNAFKGNYSVATFYFVVFILGCVVKTKKV